jgi:hypothetical protein
MLFQGNFKATHDRLAQINLREQFTSATVRAGAKDCIDKSEQMTRPTYIMLWLCLKMNCVQV